MLIAVLMTEMVILLKYAIIIIIIIIIIMIMMMMMMTFHDMHSSVNRKQTGVY